MEAGMPRAVKDEKLDTKTARAKLDARGKPYYRDLGGSLSLGYRRLAGTAGTWWARHYLGGGKYQWDSLGVADDVAEADGVGVLDWRQAVDAAHRKRHERSAPAAPENAPEITVRDAVESYIAKRDRRDSDRVGREVRSDAATRLTRYVLAADLAAVSLEALDEDALTRWRAALPDKLKASTVQRLVSDLRAALNAAHVLNRKRLNADFPMTVRVGLRSSRDDVESESAARDNQILTDAQVGALIAAAREIDAEQEFDGDLLRIVVVLAATGARFSQVARMRVGDLQRDRRRLLVPKSRKGRGAKSAAPIPVPVGTDVLDTLLPAVTGRAPDAPLLQHWRHVQRPGETRWHRDARGPWQSSSELTRAWADVRERAKMPGVICYALRHSSIVRGLRAGLPIRLVASLHDTSVAMIEKHYAKFIADGLEDLAAKAVVPLVPAVSSNITPLRTAALERAS
jgi:integrase